MNALELLAELEQEFVSTQQLLEVIPEDRLNFKPHEKAMSLGKLALHVAQIPSRNLQFAKDGQVETVVITEHPIPDNKAIILATFIEGIAAVRSLLAADADTDWLDRNWKLNKQETAIAEMPATAFIRAFVLNHWYHHRGELTTYLRMLNMKIPSIYGPTADVNPFA